MNLLCSSCNEIKSEEQFYKAKNKRGFQYTCRRCSRKDGINYRKSKNINYKGREIENNLTRLKRKLIAKRAAKKIDNCFANWLAGFIAGEGCFRIDKVKKNGTSRLKDIFKCSFKLTVRRDDLEIINYIKTNLNIGSVLLIREDYKNHPHYGIRNNKPQVTWNIDDKYGCLVLTYLFSVYSIRSKKDTDFRIWSQAVNIWTSRKRNDDWSVVEQLKKLLEISRQFDANKKEILLKLEGITK